MAKKFKESAKEKTMVYKGALFYTVFSFPPSPHTPLFGEGARGPVFGGVGKTAAYLFGLFGKKKTSKRA